MANSAHSGLNRRLGTVREVVTCLGLGTGRKLASAAVAALGLGTGRGLASAAVGALVLAGCGGAVPAAEEASPCGPVREQPADLGTPRTREVTLCLLNAERAKAGLGPLLREEHLELASQRHSEDMVARRFFEHDAPGGVDPQQRMLAAGYPALNALTGENIGWATGSEAAPAALVDLWMHSPGHRENILRAGFTQIGIGVAPGAPETPASSDPPATYTTDFGGPPVR